MCNTIRFAQADVAELAPHIIDALLAKIEKQGTPEKVAENDYLMKCQSFMAHLLNVVS